MRILHILPTYLPAVRYGGPIFAVHSLCRALIARGHAIEVATTNVNGGGVSPVPLGKLVDVSGVPVRYFASNILRRLYFAPSLADALRPEMHGFDLVHLHSVFLWPTWAVARLAQSVRVPYVVSPRGMLVKELIARRSRLAKRVWIELIERTNVERATGIHATSKLEADELQRFSWHLPNVTVVPNGVEESESYAIADLPPDVREVAAAQPYTLFLGRISWKKGLDRLLHAFARTGMGNLAIVGPDDENLAVGIRRLSGELGVGERVRVLPRMVLGPEKEHLLVSAQSFVLPSYSENFANTVLEAMSRGKPVIVTPQVGAAEIVREAGAGLVVRGDPQPLGDAMELLTTNAELALRMGEAGRQHIRAHYGWASVAGRMEAFYESVFA
jgi:glycosyltransferase involved in cell wall biosynthesis